MFQYVLLDNSMLVSNTNSRLFIMQVNDTGIELASIQLPGISNSINL